MINPVNLACPVGPEDRTGVDPAQIRNTQGAFFMFSSNNRFSEPLTKRLSSFSVFRVLFFFILFISPAIVAHGLDLSFEWDANTEPDLAGYRVFYREQGQNYDYNNPAWEGTETTCTISGLDDQKTYYFVLRVYDTYDNESENSVELSYIPASLISLSIDGPVSVNEGSYTNTDISNDGTGGGSGCFIATSAFGSKFEKHVQLLRRFRDLYLMPHHIGRVFIRAYYRYSPPIADFIARHDSLRMLVRLSLAPLIGFSWMLLHLGVLSTLLVIVLMTLPPSYLISCRKIRFRYANKHICEKVSN